MSQETSETLSDILPLTPDVRAERLAELKRLFPDLFTNEGRLNPDELRQLVEPNEIHETERYEFKWYGKAASKREAFTPTTATLVYDEARSVNPDKADGNMIIEGENLESLKLLLNAYREQVKCIYIDPPYNTGKDFIYRDNYRKDKPKYWEETGAAENGVQMESNPETSGRYHSDWLSMMHARLLVAKSLLTSDGLVFVSVDDHEIQNIRRLLDEVFGEENFIESFVWKKSYGGGAKERFAVRQHEYCLLYARDIEALDEFWLPPDPEVEKRYYKYKDEFIETKGPYRLKPFEDTNSMDAREKLRFSITAPDGTQVYPKRQWWWSQDRVDRTFLDNGIVFVKTAEGWSISYKQYLIKDDGEKRGQKPFSIIENFYTQQGTSDLRVLFSDEVVLQFPKPVRLIQRILEIAGDKDCLILDFFAGSGTTCQAVIEQNKKDGGTRKFICIQLPEVIEASSPAHAQGFRVISDITIQRANRIIQGYGANPQPIPDAGFKVYRLQKSNFPRCEFKPDPGADEAENVAALRRYIEEKEAAFFLTLDPNGEQAVFDEVLLKNGFQLHYTRTRREDFTNNTVFEVRDPRRTAFVCLAWNENIQDATIKRLRELSDNGERPFFICLERTLSTTSKWNLKHFLGDHFNAF
ncbi:MAG: site-specific DNA-methyltransferase [Akkermansiaceae bacterium]